MMKIFVKILLGILIFASITFSFISFFANKFLTDKDIYLKYILTEDFDKTIISETENKIRGEGDALAMDYDKLIDCLDKDELVNLARSYTSNFIESLFSNKSFEFNAEYESTSLYDEVRRQITEQDLEDELTDEEIEEDIETVYSYIKNDIDSSLKFIPKMITNKVSSVSNVLNKIRPYTEYDTLFLAVGLFLAVVYAIILIFEKKVLTRAFYLMIPFWCSSTIIFIPSLMLFMYGSESRLILARSALYNILSGILKAIENQLLVSSAIFFIVASVLTLIFAIIMVFKEQRSIENE